MSIISEKSNSINDESFKEKSSEFDDKHKNTIVESSQVREIVDVRTDKLFEKTHQNHLDDRKFIKNAYSYID